MKELGQFLKHTRLRSGLGTSEVCEDLDFSTSQLENIESGNFKAFKDIYELREMIKKYSNYLGLDVNKVVDEFNSYLFEKTSKISLDDIKDAEKIKEENKVKSPYTKEYKEKMNVLPIIYIVSGIIVLFLVLFIIFFNVNKTPVKSDELMGISMEEMV